MKKIKIGSCVLLSAFFIYNISYAIGKAIAHFIK